MILQRRARSNSRVLYTWLVAQLLAIAVWALAVFTTVIEPRMNVVKFVTYAAPVVILPFLFYLSKKILNIYYNRKISSEKKQLDDLVKKQKEMFDEFKNLTDYENTMRFINSYESRMNVERNKIEQEERAKRAAIEKAEAEKRKKEQDELRRAELESRKLDKRKEDEIEHLKRELRKKEAEKNMIVENTKRMSVQMSNSAQPHAVRTHAGGSEIRQRSGSVMAVPISKPIPKISVPPNKAVHKGAPPEAKGWLGSLADFVAGDGGDATAPVVCKFCKAVNGTCPKEELEHYQFICYQCHNTNGDNVPSPLPGRSPKRSPQASPHGSPSVARKSTPPAPKDAEEKKDD